MRKYDFVAIGGGNSGLTAVTKIADQGYRTALIDRGQVGGLCSLNGCNPKKVLVRSTEVLDQIRHAAKLGITTSEPVVNWSKVIDRKESFTQPVTGATLESLKQHGVDLIQGSPRFVTRNSLEINGENIETDSILISTGSVPRLLDFTGADLIKTSDDILALRIVPEKLVIIGAGVVAFEFGHVFARLGSKVTMLTPGKRALAGEDDDMVDALVDFSIGLGIELITEARIHKATKRQDRVVVEYSVEGKTNEIEADFVLNAAGRVPSIDDLDLATGQVDADHRGVRVNDYLRSVSNAAVFAAGDAHGRLQLSPVASYEGRIVVRNFLEGDVEQADFTVIPRAIYTVPPLASVGLTEAEARKRGLNISVINSDMTEWKVYAIAGEGVAKAKVIVDAGSGLLVGAHIFGPVAGEHINLFAVAMKFGATVDELKKMVYAYPTLGSSIPYMLG